MVARESSQSIIARNYVTYTKYMYNKEHVLNTLADSHPNVMCIPNLPGPLAGAHANAELAKTEKSLMNHARPIRHKPHNCQD